MYHIACEQGGRRGDEDTAASVNVKTVLVPTPAVDLQGSERYFYPRRYANPSRSGKSTSKTSSSRQQRTAQALDGDIESVNDSL